MKCFSESAYLCAMMRKNEFLQRISAHIEQKELMTPADLVLVALSGGADSVGLLLALKELGYCTEAVHCNFRLRGEESERDEYFVRDLCCRLQVPLHVTCFDTVQYAKNKKISVEMAARDLRYEYFKEVLDKRGAKCVAVAHHTDDNVETMLLNLVRGTGVSGLTGMPVRNGNVVRPLLCVRREDIEHFVAQCGESFVTDSTNKHDDVLRNKIRLNVLPMLRTLNPSVDVTLQDTLLRMSEVEEIYNCKIEEERAKVLTGNTIDIKLLLQSVAPRTVLYEILSEKGYNRRQVYEIYEQIGGVSGGVYESAEWRLLRNRNTLELQRKEDKEFVCILLPSSGEVRVSPEVLLRVSRCSYEDIKERLRDKTCAFIDAAKVDGELTVRYVQPGDKFIPYGMKGSKLISDYLTNLKKSLFEKESQLVVCLSDQIVWLVGERLDARYAVKESTREVISIEIL